MSNEILIIGAKQEDELRLATMMQAVELPPIHPCSFEEALSSCAAKKVDLLFIDVMQKSDIVLKLIASATALDGPKIPVIMIGPPTSAPRIAACLERGAEEFIYTPFSTDNPTLITRRIELALQRKWDRELDGAASDRFVPREFLNLLGRESLADIRLGDQTQQEITLFFSDIREFTSFSESITPLENFAFLNSYLTNVTPIIRAHNGFVDKYIGDAIMALFSKGNDDALKAALEIQRKMEKYNLGRIAAGYTEIKIGIGLHRGEVILGTIGEKNRMQTTVIGDTVNLASRIEGLTKTFGVDLLVSGTVVDSLKSPESFHLRHLGAVKAKGKKKSVEIYECYDNDPDSLREQKIKTSKLFDVAINEFKNGLFIAAGRNFQYIAERNRNDKPAAYYRDRCSLTAVHGRGNEKWDGADLIDSK